MLKRIRTFFQQPLVLSLLGLIALSSLIWFIGPLVKFGTDNVAPLAGALPRLLIIMVLLLLWGLNNLRIDLQRQKRNKGFITDLQHNEQMTVQGQSSEQQQLSERFSDALATLKQFKFDQGSQQKVLYELPWYMIIGAPGSGKTTALVNSGLSFPLAQNGHLQTLQGAGGTRNCDWFFTNEAVLIDTAGRYTSHDSQGAADKNAWHDFLQLLKKHRPRRPVNGVIVTLSLQDLLLATQEERVQMAKQIRSRIDELMERLQIRFPVYLMLTKGDRLAGFNEFFAALDQQQREQVWGISLPAAPDAAQAPDFEQLQQQMQKLQQRLQTKVLGQLQRERQIKCREAIYAFPSQFEQLSELVMDFIQQAFAANRYQFQPYLRGVYFTSATQDGTSIDRLMAAVTQQFGFNQEQVPSQAVQGRGYFLKHLFREVIFPESELVGTNQRFDLVQRGLRYAGYTAVSLITIGLLLAWSGGFTAYRQQVEQVAEYIKQYERGQQNTLLSTLAPMNALRDAGEVFDQPRLWLAGFGLYDSSVDKAAENAYQHELVHYFLPALIREVETVLRGTERDEALYHTFQTYLMFNQLSQFDRRVIEKWFTQHWQDTLQTREEQQLQLRNHLNQLLALQSTAELPASSLDENLVRSTRQRLQQVPLAQRVYAGIRTNPEMARNVSILDEMGQGVRQTFVTDALVKLNVPYYLTKPGYDKLDLSEQSETLKTLANERWVLADTQDTQTVNYSDDELKQLSEQIKALYFREYIVVWENILAALTIAPVKSLSANDARLRQLADPVYSPLLAVLRTVKQHTQLTLPIISNLADDTQGTSAASATQWVAGQFETTPVDKRFRPLHVLLRETAGQPAPIGLLIQRLQEIQAYTSELTRAPEVGRVAFQALANRAGGGTGNVISRAIGYAQGYPEPVRRWLLSVVNSSWRAISAQASGFVRSEWRQRVYQPYQRAIAGRYPMSADRDELGIRDFTEFFKPGGTLDKFTEEMVMPFISTRNGWRNLSIDNSSMGFSATALRSLRKAADIQQIFFADNTSAPSVTIKLKPQKMNKQDARFSLSVAEQSISYSHGPKFWQSLTWTATESNRVSLVFEDLDGQRHTRLFQGGWALLRLLEDLQIQPTSAPTVFNAQFAIRDQQQKRHDVRYLIKTGSVVNLLRNNPLKGFSLPENL